MGDEYLRTEQSVLRQFKALPNRPKRILLAVSGGVDSMVMAEILYKWRRGLKISLSLAHIHHGEAATKVQSKYRHRAQKFVEAWARKRDLPYFTNATPPPPLRSEGEMRKFRQDLLAQWRIHSCAESIAFAHHRDDLLETRLIRMIRGSGAQGLRAMCVYRNGRLRPLLHISAAEIRAYAEGLGLEWIEDPSNARADVLRNWLRHQWLPELESRRAGAVHTLARSLEFLSPAPTDFDLSVHIGLRRGALMKLPRADRRGLLARYLKGLGIKGYGHTHVDEILKRLNTRRKIFAFEMLGMKFEISPDFLWASRV